MSLQTFNYVLISYSGSVIDKDACYHFKSYHEDLNLDPYGNNVGFVVGSNQAIYCLEDSPYKPPFNDDHFLPTKYHKRLLCKGKDNLDLFNQIEQGDLVTLFELANHALDNEILLEKLNISDEYAQELKKTVNITIENLISV